MDSVSRATFSPASIAVTSAGAPRCSMTPSTASPTINSSRSLYSSSAVSASRRRDAPTILQPHRIHREHQGDAEGLSDHTNEFLDLLSVLAPTAPHQSAAFAVAKLSQLATIPHHHQIDSSRPWSTHRPLPAPPHRRALSYSAGRHRHTMGARPPLFFGLGT
jgi:hypothetical protein